MIFLAIQNSILSELPETFLFSISYFFYATLTNVLTRAGMALDKRATAKPIMA